MLTVKVSPLLGGLWAGVLEDVHDEPGLVLNVLGKLVSALYCMG